MDSLPASGSGRMMVTLTPLGSKIKMVVSGRIVCENMGCVLKNTFTYSVDDCAWLGGGIFATREDKRRFMSRGKTVKKVVAISPWFDHCDKIR